VVEPYQSPSPMTGAGLTHLHTAGTRNLMHPPTGGGGRDVQRGREPARNHQDGGSGETPPGLAAARTDNEPSLENTEGANRTGGTPRPETGQRPRNAPNGRLEQPRRRRKQLKIASLNMRGKGNRAQDKWGSISHLVRTRKIAVLALQETHPDEEWQESTERRFRNSLHLAHSADPDNPASAGGVSIVVNKSLLDASKTRHRTVVEGRVTLLEIPWNDGDVLRIMNVYAPAQNSEKADFWRRLLEMVEGEENLKPDIVMGDFNLVENPEIDRLINRGGADPPAARDELSNFVVDMNLANGWRRRHPRKRGFTYSGNGQSRLDRIYVKEDLYPWCTEWKIEHPGLQTDHSLVGVQLTSENMPFIGRGRWAIPVGLLRNRQLKRGVQELARTLQREVEPPGGEDPMASHPQLALKTFKVEAVKLFRTYQKTHQPKLENTLRSLRRELEDKANTPGLTEDEVQEHSVLIARRIEALEGKRRDEAKLLSTARNRLEGETMSKHWARSARDSAPRDTIRALRNPLRAEAPRETRTERMAETARDYHEQLLALDRDPSAEPDAEKLEEELGCIGTKLSPESVADLRKSVTEEEVAEALMASANDKAAGLDGVPTELWKLLHQQYRSAKEEERHAFCNIAGTLARVFQDISENGIAAGTGFNEGWMCPIYKKKEADNIANYRPITVLNSDYKVFTKTIATRLTEVAPSIIHPDQAGFIRGRSIFDQIEQTASTINYARLKGINGAIVALDQEKAYDKLLHPYLWKVLERFGFPEEMINTIKTLYRDAPTSIMVNGVISNPFLVTRGVRQGDPMSCILFDVGIEPLAANIRASAIRGIEVPNLDERVKVSLFADDTTVILTEHDSLTGLVAILDRWCGVSGAKFNVEKTEIIPIGTEEYRKRVIETRKINEGDANDNVPGSIHIARDRDATRVLGAWVGNRVDPEEPWRRIVEEIRKDLRRWESRYPTLEGKRLIVQMIVGGKTQFLAMAQGMPAAVQKELQKITTEFVWGKERAEMCIGDISKSINLGGRKVMDVAKRNEAIDLMWIKQYLNMGPDRPKWAFMMDEVFRMERPKKAKEPWPVIGRWNPLIQDWKPKERSKNIPGRVQSALRLARKHGVELEALEPTDETRREMPVWLHRKANREAARLYKTGAAKCLKARHRTHYMGQLVEMLESTPDQHRNTNFCACELCKSASELGCTHPHRCLEMARKLLGTVAPKWRPRQRGEEERRGASTRTRAGQSQDGGVEVCTTHESTDLKNSVQIFTTRDDLRDATGSLTRIEGTPPEEEVVAYTDGSCLSNGSDDARAGSGIWFGPDDPRNVALRVPGRKQSNQIGELLAILRAVQAVPENQPLRICSDSKFAIDGLTRHAKDWEGRNWLGVAHGPLFKCTTAWVRARTARTVLQWVKGHAGVEGNEGADALAAAGARLESEDEDIDMRFPADTMVTGAKLTRISQSAVYALLTDTGEVTRRATRQSVEKIKTATKEIFGEAPTTEAVWRSMRHRDMTKKVRDFLWKHAHGIYKLGSFWNHIPGFEDRAECPLCNKLDTFDHIITECGSTERVTVWEQANGLWRRRYDEDLPLSAGAVLGGGIANFRRRNGRPDTARNRLYRILITESAHLIWVLRCERRITHGDSPGNYHSAGAVINRWYTKINERMQVDCLLTSTYLYERKALKTRVVYDTWAKCSTNTEDLHREWCRHPGVLVGRTPGRNR
jgi:ribonuclease HI/exonuclease III